MVRSLHRPLALSAGIVSTLLAALPAQATTPADLLTSYRSAAGQGAVPDRGRLFFTQTHGREWSCATCHGEQPVGTGRHASTGKPIDPLAPAANAQRFTDPAKVEKWFRRNCNDVVGRECTAAEKSDVLAWLSTLNR